MDLNALRQLMDFYRANSGEVDYSSHQGFNASPYNPQGNALAWATRMMGGGMNDSQQRQQMPDFFGGGAGAGAGGGQPYTPSQFTPAQRFTVDQPPPAFGPPQGQSRNVLASVLKRYG